MKVVVVDEVSRGVFSAGLQKRLFRRTLETDFGGKRYPKAQLHATRSLVACRSEFVTAEAAGWVGVLPLDGPCVGGVGVDVAAELAG